MENLDRILGAIILAGALLITILRFLKYIRLPLLNQLYNIFKRIKPSQKDKNETSDVQVRFGDATIRDDVTYSKRKINWDSSNEILINKDKFKDKTSSGLIRQSRKIKTFEEFVGTPEMLHLNLGGTNKMYYNLKTGKFTVNNIEYGAQIPNVLGLEKLTNSKIDNNPIIRLKFKSEDPLIVKVNIDNNRLEVINDLKSHFKSQTVNSKDSFFTDSSIVLNKTHNSKYH